MRLNLTCIVSLCMVVTCCVSISMIAWADDSGTQRERSAVERGLKFLQLDAVKWRQEKTCSTCHHGTLTMWVQLEAKSRGYAVDTEVLQEIVRWAKERILERVD